jgi:ribonuclease E
MNVRDTNAADADDDDETDDGDKAIAISAVMADDEDEGDDRPRRRRRRGKRGGKRNRREDDGAESATGDDSVAEQEVPPSPDRPVAEDGEADAGKSSVMAERLPSEAKQTDAVCEETHASSSTSVGEEAAASPRGRNTRRPKVPAPRVNEAEKEVVTVDTKEATGEPKSKKSGWWSRGGGFFN